MNRHLLLLTSLALVASPVLGHVAHAKGSDKPKVALTKIDGDDDDSVFAVISEALDEDLNLVAQRDLNKAEHKLNLAPDDELTDKDVGKIETKLEATALIRGSVEKKGETMALHLKVYVKGTAKPKSFTVKFSNLGSAKFKKSLHDTVIDKLGLEAAGGDEAEEPAEKPVKPPKVKDKKPKKPPVEDPADSEAEEPAEKPVKPPKVAKDKDKIAKDKDKKPKKPPVEDPGDASEPTETAVDKDKDKAKPKTTGEEGGDEEASGGGDEEGTAEVTVHAKATASTHAANRDAMRVDVGVSVTGRQLTFASRSFDQAPKPFKNNPVPGARVDGEVYPIAFGSNPRSALAGLGFGFDFDRTLALTLKSLNPADGTVITAKATQQRYAVGPRYRILFGSSDTAPSLTLAVDYGSRSFIVARGGLAMGATIDLPDVRYKAVMPGVTVRLPFTARAALSIGAQALLVTDAGQIEKADQYGQSKVTGAQATVGLDVLFGSKFVFRLEGEFAQVGFVFAGTGAMTINRDGDPTTKDIGGASDRYFGGAATLAVLY